MVLTEGTKVKVLECMSKGGQGVESITANSDGRHFEMRTREQSSGWLAFKRFYMCLYLQSEVLVKQ